MSVVHDNVNVLIKDLYLKLHAMTKETIITSEENRLKFKTEYSDKRVAKIILKKIQELEKLKYIL